MGKGAVEGGRVAKSTKSIVVKRDTEDTRKEKAMHSRSLRASLPHLAWQEDQIRRTPTL